MDHTCHGSVYSFTLFSLSPFSLAHFLPSFLVANVLSCRICQVLCKCSRTEVIEVIGFCFHLTHNNFENGTLATCAHGRHVVLWTQMAGLPGVCHGCLGKERVRWSSDGPKLSLGKGRVVDRRDSGQKE